MNLSFLQIALIFTFICLLVAFIIYYRSLPEITDKILEESNH